MTRDITNRIRFALLTDDDGDVHDDDGLAAAMASGDYVKWGWWGKCLKEPSVSWYFSAIPERDWWLAISRKRWKENFDMTFERYFNFTVEWFIDT
jgi:hypothetical protein